MPLNPGSIAPRQPSELPRFGFLSERTVIHPAGQPSPGCCLSFGDSIRALEQSVDHPGENASDPHDQ